MIYSIVIVVFTESSKLLCWGTMMILIFKILPGGNELTRLSCNCFDRHCFALNFTPIVSNTFPTTHNSQSPRLDFPEFP